MPTRPVVTATHIGNATLLLRFGAITVLTDPNFLHRGQRAHLGYGLSTRRLTEPTAQPADLPPLDLVVLSHLHGDHWDRIAERGLDRDLPVWTTPAAGRTLRRRGFERAEGLRTWETHTVRRGDESLTMTAAPGSHARGPVRHLLPPVMGSVLEYRRAPDADPLTVYVTGDTLLGDALREVPRRFPVMDVAVLHLGGTTLPGGLLVTMDAGQGAELVARLPAPTAVPVHHSDYSRFRSGLEDFLDEAARRGLRDRVTVLTPGHPTDLGG